MRCKYYYPLKKDHESRTYTSDICIYGATASGIVAAVEAARSGKKVNLVEFSRFIGGMTTSGLSATDIGDKDAIGASLLSFTRSLETYMVLRSTGFSSLMLLCRFSGIGWSDTK